MTYDALIEDDVMQLALVKLPKIVGEAASHVSTDGRARAAGVPWQKIVGMRHHLVHGYDQIDYEVVWQVLSKDIGDLVLQLEPLCPTDRI